MYEKNHLNIQTSTDTKIQKKPKREKREVPQPKMEPMNPPPAESPTNLRRQTAAPLEGLGTNALEGLGLGLGLGFELGSNSLSESVIGESDDVAAAAAMGYYLFYQNSIKIQNQESENTLSKPPSSRFVQYLIFSKRHRRIFSIIYTYIYPYDNVHINAIAVSCVPCERRRSIGLPVLILLSCFSKYTYHILILDGVLKKG